MALTFATNSLRLVNWGFSATDILTLVAAGRGVITWINAHSRDSNLLSFLNVDETDLRLRPGLLDPIALNKRWGKDIVLLKNGKPEVLKTEGDGAEIENIRRFTWMMTLITACLEAVMASKCVKIVICDLISKLFADATEPGFEEFLQRDILMHIEGWRSTAIVRMISPRARDIWDKLEKQGDHLPGFIPEQENQELARMLVWIVVKGEDTFYTNSSDLYSVAFMLAELGFDLLRVAVEKADSKPLGVVTLIKTEDAPWNNHAARPAQPVPDLRRGMRIPLLNVEDTVVLWPENPERNEHRRVIFANGISAARDIFFRAGKSSEDGHPAGLAIRVESTAKRPPRDAPTNILVLIDRYFLISTDWLFSALRTLQNTCKMTQKDIEYLSELGEYTYQGEEDNDLGVLGEDFQIFLMGYYYKALSSIVDTSRLVYKEAFGSWGWADPRFFRHILQLTQSRIKSHRREKLYWRYRVIRLVGYLFAGAEEEVVSSINSDAVGLVSKLSVLASALFGDADTPEKLSKLVLLDVDTSSIPTNGLGIIKTANSHKAKASYTTNTIDCLDPSTLTPCNPDFTSSIEPAWGYDVNLVLVSYRYKGRLVFKVDPLETELAIVRGWASDSPALDQITSKNLDCQFLRNWILDQHTRCQDSLTDSSLEFFDCTTSMAIQSPSDYCAGFIYLGPYVDPDEYECPHEGFPHVVVIRTKGLSKARCCILSMHGDFFHENAGFLSSFPWAQYFPGCLVGETLGGTGVVIA